MLTMHLFNHSSKIKIGHHSENKFWKFNLTKEILRMKDSSLNFMLDIMENLNDLCTL